MTMRGKVSDQDLTDYALNELPPNERLYVESMLGVSEECRNDVYAMLEMGEMLKELLEELGSMRRTQSWQLTAPLRRVASWFGAKAGPNNRRQKKQLN